MLQKIEIKLCKVDEDLVEKIMKKREFPEEKREIVRNMLRYNCWTFRQFSDLTGLNLSTIQFFTLMKYNKQGELVSNLDICYPFQGIDDDGPKFIVRNEKSMRYLVGE